MSTLYHNQSGKSQMENSVISMPLGKVDHENASHNTLQPKTTISDIISSPSEPATEREPLLENGWGPATLDFLDSISAKKLDKKAYISGHLYTRTQAKNCLQFYTLLRNYMKCNLHFYTKLNLAHSTEIDGRSNISTMLQTNISPEELNRTVIKAGMGQIHIAMSESIDHRKEMCRYAYDRLLGDTDSYLVFSQNRNYFAHAHGVMGKDGFEFTGGIYTTIATKYEEALPKIELILAKLEQVSDDESSWEIREEHEEVVAVCEPRSGDNGKLNEDASEGSDDDNDLDIGGEFDNINSEHPDDENGINVDVGQSVDCYTSSEASQGKVEDKDQLKEDVEAELPPF